MRWLPAWSVGEVFGTFLLVFFGCGSVCAAVTTGAQVGVFQVAIHLTGALSGAHLNPAVTVSMAAWAARVFVARWLGRGALRDQRPRVVGGLHRGAADRGVARGRHLSRHIPVGVPRLRPEMG